MGCLFIWMNFSRNCKPKKKKGVCLSCAFFLHACLPFCFVVRRSCRSVHSYPAAVTGFAGVTFRFSVGE